MKYEDSLSNKQIYTLMELCSASIKQHLIEYKAMDNTKQAHVEQKHIHSVIELSEINRVLQRILVNQNEV